MKFEFRSYHDYGTTGVVYTFTKQVLTETTLLTAKQTAQRLQFAVACARLRTFAAAVVQQTVHGVLQHTLFVVDKDFRRVDFDKFLQTIVTVDDSAVQIVEVAGCVSAAVKGYHCTKFRRKYGQYGQYHPFGAVAALAEGFHNVQTFDCADLLCALIGLGKGVAKFLRFCLEVNVLQQFAHYFRTCTGAEILRGVFLCTGLRLAVFVHAENLLVGEVALHGVYHYVTLEVDKLFKVLGGHIQDKTHARRRTSEIPDVRYGAGKFDVTHALATHLAFCYFYTALFANDTLVTDTLVLSAVAFPVLDRPEDAFAEQAVAFRLLGAVVDCFGLFDFTEGPFADLFGRSDTDLYCGKVVHYARPCQCVGTQR